MSLSGISDFWLNVLASIVASILFTLLAKVALDKWKKVAIGLGAMAIIAMVGSFIVFAAVTVTKEIVSYRERVNLQDKVSAYVNGHYPDEVKKGYGVEVIGVGARVYLGFAYPKGHGYPEPSPLSTSFFEAEITNLLNDNGYSGRPLWGYLAQPLSVEQVENLNQTR
ncbi:hypothetical protein M3A49_26750 [Paraburkholderia sp. CNPSo 3076]|uniref:hypothetical protein n=1 Tax=Paraburkholderia sp. CNPSo 3076 TaxID=2940936 RepID=UPI0022592E88|nr:hypothetical protein [Paraburkholderia sp. CNPSo 3076]MCX5543045.1 hypothetical protein [Paraburkholderia sp. CNPSo 3076]